MVLLKQRSISELGGKCGQVCRDRNLVYLRKSSKFARDAGRWELRAGAMDVGRMQTMDGLVDCLDFSLKDMKKCEQMRFVLRPRPS